MQRVYADTSYYYAVADARDAHHAEARAVSQRVASLGWGVVSSWEVIVETITLLRYRHGYRGAVAFIEHVLPAIEVIYITDAIRQHALTKFRRLARDKHLSLCDIISYLLVTEHLGGIPCLAFDHDFSQLGLKVVSSA